MTGKGADGEETFEMIDVTEILSTGMRAAQSVRCGVARGGPHNDPHMLGPAMVVGLAPGGVVMTAQDWAALVPAGYRSWRTPDCGRDLTTPHVR
jgi:hypothetical protein